MDWSVVEPKIVGFCSAEMMNLVDLQEEWSLLSYRYLFNVFVSSS